MSEAPTKKRKMSDEASTSTSQPLREIFDPDCQEFAWVRLSPTFVDHTELIKLFFEDKPTKLFVTAPSHFCKSTNLSMLRLFFERKSDGTVESIVKERQSYHVFDGTKIMTIASEDHLSKHFCSHPVLHVNFAILKLDHYNHALRHIRNRTFEAYRYHESYLEANLNDRDKKRFQMELSKLANFEITTSVKPDTTLLSEGLKNLCSYLYMASGGKRVLILIDEADSLVTAALTNGLSLEETKNIGLVMADLLGNITKGDIDRQLQGVLLTGISQLKCTGFSKKVKAKPHRFLDDRALHGSTIVNTYCLTEVQLAELLVKLQGKGLLRGGTIKEITNIIKEHYNGYYTIDKKTPVYSLWSVLYYLQDLDTSAIHADLPAIAEYYTKAFKGTVVGRNILQLLADQNVRFTYVNEIELKQLVDLRDVEQETADNRDTLFTLLMEVGFLTNSEKERPTDQTKLIVNFPNKQVKSVFRSMMVKNRIQIGKFDLALQQECAREINELAVAKDKDALKQHLKSIYEKLVKLCQQFDEDCFNEYFLKVLITMIMFYSEFQNTLPERYSKEDRGYIDVSSTSENLKCTSIWELKYNRGHAENKTSMWAMKEILGHEETPKKGYMNAGNKTTKFILLGLSVNEERKPSICFRNKEHEKGIFVSKTEHNIANFARHYEGWYDLLKEDYVGPPLDVGDNSNWRFQDTAHSPQLNSVS